VKQNIAVMFIPQNFALARPDIRRQ